MSERILVVEDEESIREIVCLYLRRAGFQVAAVPDGAQALETIERQIPGLVILDLMLPNVDGWEITRRMRSAGDIPIIMLTARKEETDRIAGLEMGADDYVVKPFSPQELVSRVRAVLRRARTTEPDMPGRPLSIANITIDPMTRTVTVDGDEVALTVKEFDLLWLFTRHPHQVFNRDQLLDQVWGTGDYIDPGTVTVHIRRLREKIERNPAAPRLILTVWGVGYRFDPE